MSKKEKFKFPDFFHFSKHQQLGIIGLVSVIVIFQLIIIFYPESKPIPQSAEEKQWLALQPTYKAKENQYHYKKDTIYPFNPNFITEFKGYKLEMTASQINKLLEFRKLNKFANSPEEFQAVTGVSNEWIAKYSPHFKFPDWVKNRNNNNSNFNNNYSKKEALKIIDINSATKEDLMKIYGIGDAISDRILKQKEIFGNFATMDQMQDIWGLSPEVVEKLNQSFKIINTPTINKIKINDASIKELGAFPYFRYPMSKNIVTYRTMNGDIKIEDLAKIKDFPVEKIKIIALYLEF